MTDIRANKHKVLITTTGLIIIAAGLVIIFAFSTQILVPAQPATPGHYDAVGGRMVWRAGQPSQPEHFETAYPNFPAGLILILVGSAVSAAGHHLRKREEDMASLSNLR